MFSRGNWREKGPSKRSQFEGWHRSKELGLRTVRSTLAGLDMGITRCVSECLHQTTDASCTPLWGCQWKNASKGSLEMSINGTCVGLGGGKDIASGGAWIGMLLAVLGNIVIK